MLIVADCLNDEDTWHVASVVCRKPLLLLLMCVQNQRNRLSSSVCRPYIVKRVNCCWMVRLHGCIAWRWWHLTQQFICYLLPVKVKHCFLSRKHHSELFYYHFLLCTSFKKLTSAVLARFCTLSHSQFILQHDRINSQSIFCARQHIC